MYTQHYFEHYDQQDFKEKPHTTFGVTHNHAPDHGNQGRVSIYKNAKSACVVEKFKAPGRIIMEEIKKTTDIAGRDMPDIDNATRRLRMIHFLIFERSFSHQVSSKEQSMLD
ncbi:Uncharacterized protein APZ42_020305 [Daphnia magna]|uniref:Uncharacterized protein n=1 Tax=Daphnia magna TaxID=35525 RepID=A0A164XKB2_9CRUS|nr:Uncharacterized protein APZ42_020305 [Daphnia magna]